MLKIHQDGTCVNATLSQDKLPPKSKYRVHFSNACAMCYPFRNRYVVWRCTELLPLSELTSWRIGTIGDAVTYGYNEKLLIFSRGSCNFFRFYLHTHCICKMCACVISFNCSTTTNTIILYIIVYGNSYRFVPGYVLCILDMFAAFQRLSIHYKSYNIFLNVFQSEV